MFLIVSIIRPLSMDTLAIGCEKGIFIWTIEFNNIHMKPTINNVCKFVRNDHRYITGLSWNKMVKKFYILNLFK